MDCPGASVLRSQGSVRVTIGRRVREVAMQQDMGSILDELACAWEKETDECHAKAGSEKTVHRAGIYGMRLPVVKFRGEAPRRIQWCRVAVRHILVPQPWHSVCATGVS